MKTLLFSALLLSGADVVVMLVTVGQTRFLAETIGPSGFGVYSLLQAFFRVFGALGATWMSVSATRWISSYIGRGDAKGAKQVFSAGLLLTSVVTGSGAVVFFLLHDFFIDRLLSKEVLLTYFLLFTGIMMVTSFRTFFNAVLQGLLQIRWISSIRLLVALVQLASVVSLTALFGITGFFTGLLIAGAVAVIASLLVIYSRSDLRPGWVRFSSGRLRPFLAFGGVDLSTIIAFSAVEFAQRRIVLGHLGLPHLGFMYAALSIMNNLDILNRSALVYLFPKMARDEKGSIQDDIDDHMLFALYSGIPIASFSLLFTSEIVALLLGTEFSMLEGHMYLFILWFLLNTVHNPFSNVVLSMAKLRVHAVATFGNSATALAVLVTTIGPLGFPAIGLALISGLGVAYLVRLVYLWHARILRVQRRVVTLHLAAAASFALSYVAQDWPLGYRLAILAGVLGYLYISLEKHERNAVLGGRKWLDFLAKSG